MRTSSRTILPPYPMKLSAGGEASRSVAPSPIIVTFTCWPNDRRIMLMASPLPPVRDVGWFTSKPAYLPKTKKIDSHFNFLSLVDKFSASSKCLRNKLAQKTNSYHWIGSVIYLRTYDQVECPTHQRLVRWGNQIRR